MKDSINKRQHADVDYEIQQDGKVLITTRLNGEVVHTGTDDVIGGPIYGQGAVGIRGDNTEFYFDKFQVTSLN